MTEQQQKKQRHIDNIFHAQHAYSDDSGLLVALRGQLMKLPLVTLAQLALIARLGRNHTRHVALERNPDAREGRLG
jgi:hypothetical protein